jgi:hypothetical protein
VIEQYKRNAAKHFSLFALPIWRLACDMLQQIWFLLSIQPSRRKQAHNLLPSGRAKPQFWLSRWIHGSGYWFSAPIIWVHGRPVRSELLTDAAKRQVCPMLQGLRLRHCPSFVLSCAQLFSAERSTCSNRQQGFERHRPILHRNNERCRIPMSNSKPNNQNPYSRWVLIRRC